MIEARRLSSGSSGSLLLNFCQDFAKNCLCLVRSWLYNMNNVIVSASLRIHKGQEVCNRCNAVSALCIHSDREESLSGEPAL